MLGLAFACVFVVTTGFVAVQALNSSNGMLVERSFIRIVLVAIWVSSRVRKDGWRAQIIRKIDDTQYYD